MHTWGGMVFEGGAERGYTKERQSAVVPVAKGARAWGCIIFLTGDGGGLGSDHYGEVECSLKRGRAVRSGPGLGHCTFVTSSELSVLPVSNMESSVRGKTGQHSWQGGEQKLGCGALNP